MNENTGGEEPTNLGVNGVYDFQAIIMRANATGYGPRRTSAKPGQTPSNNIVVYPTNVENGTPGDIPTDVKTIKGNREVKSVKYVNVAGMVSDKPFEGVNIIITEYTDGSRSTVKQMR